MGVPVITLTGSTHVSRVSTSLLSAAGLTEYVAPDEDAYVDLGIAIAQRGKRSIELRQKLREQVARSPLCDEVSFTRKVEAALREMWVNWCGKT
jgi:predicted O-linked N-acetylglucosamine transferase (SPINDLY family)